MNFASAMQKAADVLARLEASSAADASATGDIVDSLRSFLESEEGARGFFVTFLTGNFRIADQPPAALLEAIRQAPESANNVLVKNLVMSAATAVVHQRNGDRENAEGSNLVLARTKRLFQDSHSAALQTKAQEMLASIRKQSDSFAPFLARVNYDEEQITAATRALDEVLSA